MRPYRNLKIDALLGSRLSVESYSRIWRFRSGLVDHKQYQRCLDVGMNGNQAIGVLLSFFDRKHYMWWGQGSCLRCAYEAVDVGIKNQE